MHAYIHSGRHKTPELFGGLTATGTLAARVHIIARKGLSRTKGIQALEQIHLMPTTSTTSPARPIRLPLARFDLRLLRDWEGQVEEGVEAV